MLISETYLRFRLSGPSSRMTDDEVSTFLLTNLRDIHYPDRWNAGYVLGWLTALLERPGEASERALSCEVCGHGWQPGLLTGLLLCGRCHEAVGACPLCHPWRSRWWQSPVLSISTSLLPASRRRSSSHEQTPRTTRLSSYSTSRPSRA